MQFVNIKLTVYQPNILLDMPNLQKNLVTNLKKGNFVMPIWNVTSTRQLAKHVQLNTSKWFIEITHCVKYQNFT